MALLYALPLERVALAGITSAGLLLERAGVGPDPGRAGAERAVSAGADALLSIGFCGAADPRLVPGDVIVATDVVDEMSGRILACDTGLTARVAGRRGRLATRGRIARTPEERRLSAGLAIDMESAAIAEVAMRAELPFAAVRAVSDAAGTRLPAAIDETGQIRLGALRPSDIPALLRLGAGAGRAMLALRRATRQLLALPR